MNLVIGSYQIKVDSDLFNFVSKLPLGISGIKNHKYASVFIDGEMKLLHRLIMQADEGEVVDHINGDCLDNTISNLRICSHAENIRNSRKPSNNTTGYKGVRAPCGRVKKFRASLEKMGKFIHLGYFNTAKEAAIAYDIGAKKYFGEFAKTNFT